MTELFYTKQYIYRVYVFLLFYFSPLRIPKVYTFPSPFAFLTKYFSHLQKLFSSPFSFFCTVKLDNGWSLREKLLKIIY